MKKLFIFTIIFLLSAIPLSNFAVAFTPNVTVCSPGGPYVYRSPEGIAPVTETPTFSYGPDGLVQFHYHILSNGVTDIGYSHFNGDCSYSHRQISGLHTSHYGNASHLLLKAVVTNPSIGAYNFRAFDEDTGQDITSDLGLFPPDFGTNGSMTFDFVIFSQDPQAFEVGGVSTPAVPVLIPNFQPQKTPVLIVPGLFGTDINKGSTLLWADVVRMVNPFNDDSFMDPLQFNTNLNPLDTSLTLGSVIDKRPKFDYTDGLINLFTSPEIGYTEGKDLFTFPYDWRYGVSEDTVNQLKGQINYILTQTDAGKAAGKVDVIAHSTGGLLVKKYIMEHPTNHGIDKAVFVGVPNLGAPKAFKALISGDNFGVPGLNAQEMKKLAQNLPISYDLAPTAQYASQIGSFLQIHNPFASPNAIDQDLSYNDAIQHFEIQHLVNSQGVSNSQNLHTQDFDTYDIRSNGVDTYNIIGCKTGTLGKFTETVGISGAAAPNYDFPQDTSGDGTVPLLSAQTIPADPSHIFFAPQSEHGKMPSEDGIRQQIVNLLSGSTLNTNGKILNHDSVQQNPSLCQIKGESINIKSPVAVTVTDQDGNFSGLADDGSVQNDIPGADYQIWGEHKYVFLPTDGGQTYNINLKGTGSGTFTLDDQSINGDSVTQTQIFSNLPVTPDLLGQVNLGNATTLTIQATPTSTPVVVNPSAILNSDQSQDITPPVSISTLSGTLGQPGFYKSDVSVSLSAVDPNVNGNPGQTSGILTTSYRLDNASYMSYNSPIVVSGEGPHSLTFFSTDRAGNNETPQTLNFTIDKTLPEISFQFSPATKDFSFGASDNSGTSPQLACQTGQCIATDQSGNATFLNFNKVNLPLNIKNLVLKNIAYNGQVFSFDQNLFTTAYTLSSGFISGLSQTELIKNQQIINVTFSQKQNQSIITDWSKGVKPQISTMPGMKILQISTSGGKIKTSVK